MYPETHLETTGIDIKGIDLRYRGTGRYIFRKENSLERLDKQSRLPRYPQFGTGTIHIGPCHHPPSPHPRP